MEDVVRESRERGFPPSASPFEGRGLDHDYYGLNQPVGQVGDEPLFSQASAEDLGATIDESATFKNIIKELQKNGVSFDSRRFRALKIKYWPSGTANKPGKQADVAEWKKYQPYTALFDTTASGKRSLDGPIIQEYQHAMVARNEKGLSHMKDLSELVVRFKPAQTSASRKFQIPAWANKLSLKKTKLLGDLLDQRWSFGRTDPPKGKGRHHASQKNMKEYVMEFGTPAERQKMRDPKKTLPIQETNAICRRIANHFGTHLKHLDKKATGKGHGNALHGLKRLLEIKGKRPEGGLSNPIRLSPSPPAPDMSALMGPASAIRAFEPDTALPPHAQVEMQPTT